MSITQQHSQEAMSLAYIHAVSGLAGLNIQLGSRHDYGVDGSIRSVVVRGNRRVESGTIVDFQLKASHNWEVDGEFVVYDLEVKNYNDLVSRDPDAPAFILVLLCMPKNVTDWLVSDEQALVLRNCCYWFRPTGAVSGNKVSKRIRLPRQNVLTPEAMRELLAAERAKILGLP